MRRAVKVTLKFATAKKRRAIDALLSRYRSAVNFYIRSLWNERGKLDTPTLARLQSTELSARYKSQALKQALEIVVSTRKAAKAIGKPATCPVFSGSATLDAKFVSIEDGRGSFDLIVKVSSLVPGKRITIPTKHTAVTRKWLARGQFIQGCSIREDSLTLWIEVPDEPPKEGRTLGVDIGINKLLSDSDGNHYGIEFKAISAKIRRSKPKSKARYRHYAERTNFINRVVNLLPWTFLSVIGVEALCDMKRGKQKRRGKAFRKAIAPWVYRRVLDRISHKATENRVRLIAVEPAYTSQTCPTCHTVSRESRRGEKFQCVACNCSGDADYIGALNILECTRQILRSVESLGPIKAV